MPPPTSPVLDDFNALPNFLLTDREGWDTSPLWAGTSSLITNPSPTCAVRSDAAFQSNRWPMSGVDDQECWITLTATGIVSIYTRLVAGTPVNGYELQWLNPGGLVPGQMIFSKVVDDVETTLGAISTLQGQNAGDSLALSSVGSVHTIWHRADGGSWVNYGSINDTTFATGGDLGVSINSTTEATAIDTFGGGGTAGVDGSYAPRRGGSRR